MSKEEIKLINEISEYQRQLLNTDSNQRKSQLNRHIKKLQRELKLYRKLRYGL